MSELVDKIKGLRHNGLFIAIVIGVLIRILLIPFASEYGKNDYEYIEGKGCYVCIKPKHKDSRTVTDELKENGILILCGKDGLTGWLRVTITGAKYMDQFFDALLKIDR